MNECTGNHYLSCAGYQRRNNMNREYYIDPDWFGAGRRCMSHRITFCVNSTIVLFGIVEYGRKENTRDSQDKDICSYQYGQD